MRRLTIPPIRAGFCADVIKTIRAIEAESQQPGNEFAIFVDTPWIIKQAAVHYPTDPRRFLRDVIKTQEGDRGGKPTAG